MSILMCLREVQVLEQMLIIAHVVLISQSCSVSAEGCGTDDISEASIRKKVYFKILITTRLFSLLTAW